MFKQSYKHNIVLLGASEFLGFFGITSFWLLFLSQHGMNLWQIGLLESIFHGTSLLSEIPSGLLADRFTYKTNLYLGRVMKIFSAFAMLWGNGHFGIYALGMILNAWSYNFDSGTSSAFLFESAKEAGLEGKYLTYSSFISGITEATMTLGKVVAGFLVHGFLGVAYIIEIMFSCLVLVLISLMKEPTIKIARTENPTLSSILGSVRQTFKTNPRLLEWLLLSQFVGVLMCMFYFYYQNELTHLAAWQISVVMLLSSAINICAVWLASRIGKRLTARQLFPLLVLVTALLYLLAVFNIPLVYVVIYLLTDGAYAFFVPIYNNDLQANLDSSSRATMLSVSAMFFSLSMILIFPLIGGLIEMFGISTTFVILGSLLAGISLFMLGKIVTNR